MFRNTTIAAISTALGAGGIGIVRVSGEQSIAIVERIFFSNNGLMLSSLTGYRGILGKVISNGVLIDEAIVYVYRSPKSYTGEDVVEISCHGGVEILRMVLRLCIDFGAEIAEPGEFTKRAYLNGKLDLSQAEAVMQMISARGEVSVKAAASAREGILSKEISKMKEALLGYAAHLSVWMDYPDDEFDTFNERMFLDGVTAILSRLHSLIDNYERGRMIREGIHVVLVGKPNVGKSTLMNFLSGEQRSIVTDIPGTTRDIVEDMISLGGYTLILSDTAGLRETENPIEKIGVEMALQQIENAQLVLAVFDGAADLDEIDLNMLQHLKGKQVIGIINKSDMPIKINISRLKEQIPLMVTISARDHLGRDQLEQAILSLLSLDDFDCNEAIIANERQRSCVVDTALHLEEAVSALCAGVTLDAVGVCIDSALSSLMELTGENVSERIVEEIFANFCVGK